MSLQNILLFVVFIGFLVGCTTHEESYKKGLTAGLKEGKSLGYEQGYEKGFADGYERSKPGTPFELSGFQRTLYKLIVWGGSLKIFLSLLIAALLILGLGKSSHKVVGKVLFGILGSIFAILVVTYLHISQIVEAVLLAGAPSSLWKLVGWAILSALAMYGLLEAFYRFLRETHSSIVEGWMMFILASIITLMAPVLWEFNSKIPDITKYFGAVLFSGALIGGIYWVAYGLLSGKLLGADWSGKMA